MVRYKGVRVVEIGGPVCRVHGGQRLSAVLLFRFFRAANLRARYPYSRDWRLVLLGEWMVM